MATVVAPAPDAVIRGDTPAVRLFSLLELITNRPGALSLADLVSMTGVPKPTLHRMLQRLEAAGLVRRQEDGRRYALGERARRFAEGVLLNSPQDGARHKVLAELVGQIGETCNLTALSGGEVIYLDRVETPEPLRFYLRPGSRVPAHCSASGKVILSQFPHERIRKLLGTAPLKQHTPQTITEQKRLEEDLELARERGYAIDDEEFLPGLNCAAVLVPVKHGKESNLAVAVQAPIARVTPERLVELVPVLQEAAERIAELDQ